MRRVPFSITCYMGGVHIATPYAAVAADFATRAELDRTRFELGHGADEYRRQRGRAITDALIVHRRNRAEYRAVMSW